MKRGRVPVRYAVPVARDQVRGFPVTPSQPVDRAGGGQPLQRRARVMHRLAGPQAQRRQESLLETVLGVGAPAQQPGHRPPHGRPVPLDDAFPVHVAHADADPANQPAVHNASLAMARGH